MLLTRRSVALHGAAATLLAGPTLVGLPRTARAQETVASGTFEDVGGHGASGGVRVVREGSGFRVEMADDFRLDRAPDPYVAFGSAEAYAPGTDFAVLESRRGAQGYAVPEGLDPTEHGAVWLWCREFAVPLGVARLAP